MNTMPIADIKIKFRQRKAIKPGPLTSLKEGIASKGLFHPIVLRIGASGTIRLVAGERRLRAISELHTEHRTFTFNNKPVPPREIPYVMLSDLDGLHILEAELEENILREDLSWQERADALASIHELRILQHPGQSEKQTAREIATARGSAVSAVNSELQRSRMVTTHMDDPEVAGARNLHEAFRIASRKHAASFSKEYARRNSGRVASAHSLICGDLFEEMKKLKEDKYACIITDPPYGIDAGKFGSASARHSYSDDAETAIDIASHIISEGYNLCLERAHLYMFCHIEHFLVLREHAEFAGWHPWRTPLIWHKGSTAHAPWAGDGYRHEYEMILFAVKGSRPLIELRSDIFPVLADRDKQHPAQKPVELYRRLLAASCYAGEHVLDPCCGTGPIFPAASALTLLATGIELDPATHVLAQDKLLTKEPSS